MKAQLLECTVHEGPSESTWEMRVMEKTMHGYFKNLNVLFKAIFPIEIARLSLPTGQGSRS